MFVPDASEYDFTARNRPDYGQTSQSLPRNLLRQVGVGGFLH
jgi:hypothetical protein